MRFLSILLAFAALGLASNTYSQGRSLGASQLVIDNGSGGKLTIVYSGTGNDTLHLDGSALGALPEGLLGQTLHHNGTSFDTTSTLTNNGAIIGLNGGVRNAFRTMDDDNTGLVLTDYDHTVKVQTLDDSVSLYLPEPSPGRVITIIGQDVCGDCQVQNVYIYPNADEEIDGWPGYHMMWVPWDRSVTFVSDGTDWFIVSRYPSGGV